MRTITAARSGSVLIAVQGAASCRYSLPSTQSARSAWADLRISIASSCSVSSASLRADVAHRASAPAAPARRRPEPRRRTASRRTCRMRLTKLPNTSARSRFTADWNCSQVKPVSEPSGLLAVRYQRQQSAGSSSSAWSMKTPRLLRGGELAAVPVQPVERLQHVDHLPRLAASPGWSRGSRPSGRARCPCP